ncbi:Lrp/AsnC family transcriptional regulator [Devosia sp. CN2-171]|uniref:Lrp/AsnC family transcriptional regulator n=1 Tax=Devosia sp. CN2-171 TaxID=3400909 RepID=UPI003BF8B5B1
MAESTFSLDDLDHRLIALLRTDGRLPVAKLATELGVSRATVSARMERLVKTGAIAGYTVMLRSTGRADAVRAITMVEIDGKNSEAIIRRLTGFPEIRTLYTTNGRWDVVAEIETPTLREFDELLRKIRQVDGIANTETSILLTARKELG